ncbi:MAG TPA: GAF domain-containing sensor histidine kinase [Candidatus Dormibacteraeota bacterium]|nr:GAF domain-containing sensor histidine kinase [Candidatus Dormibacteraeota bacterium]
MSSDRQPPLNLVRQLVVGNLDKPLFELLDRALACLMQGLDARAALYGKVDENTLEILAAQVQSGPSIEPGLRMPLEATFALLEEDALGGITNIRDATKSQPHKSLPMRRQLGIVSYLGAPLRNARGELIGTLAVIGKGARTFTDADQDLLLVVAGLLAPRLRPEAPPANGQGRAPVSAVRLASEEVKEPLAILRGYADMLRNNEVPADKMPEVAQRLAMQSETLMRIADQVMLLSRLPLELAFTVRVSLGAVAQSAAARIRERLSSAGMDLRLQLDTHSEVWGDATLLEAALDEMLHNVFQHAQSATVVQLRLRQSTAERCQLIVKDDGPGMSADRLAELFSPLADEQPARGQGLGLYLLRRVAEAHGGRAWANSLEGKGTTFYLELPAASPDGDSARASATAGQTSA